MMIKKGYIFTALFILYCVWNVLGQNKPPYPQEGQLFFKLYIDQYRNEGRGMNSITCWVDLSDVFGSIIWKHFEKPGNIFRTPDIENGETVEFNATYETYINPMSKKRLEFSSFRTWNFGANDGVKSNSIIIPYGTDNYYYRTGLFDNGSITGHTILNPRRIDLWAFVDGKDTETLQMPNDEYIYLKATKGFESLIYNWEYQIGNSGWKKLPDNLQYANNKSEVMLKWTDLFTKEQFVEYLKKGNSIIFRINTFTQEQGLEGKNVSLSLACTAPHIIETQAVQPTCYGYNNGEIRVRLSRALYEGEKIAVFINSNNREIDNFSSWKKTIG